jgi:hypothetical protein
MCSALLMQLGIGIDDALHNPGTVLSVARGLGAMLHHRGKSAVDANFTARIVAKFLQSFAQAAVQAKLVGMQGHARVGRPPEHRLSLAEPRENALTVSGAKTCCIKRIAGGQQPGMGSRSPRSDRWGEFLFGLQPGQGVRHWQWEWMDCP